MKIFIESVTNARRERITNHMKIAICGKRKWM